LHVAVSYRRDPDDLVPIENYHTKDGVSLHEHAVEDSTREWIQEYPLLAEKTPEEL
jgi:hypothetical protein